MGVQQPDFFNRQKGGILLKLKSNRFRQKCTPYLLAAPSALLTVLVVGYPILYTIYISFFSWKLSSPEHDFIGFENYQWLLDNDLWKIVLNTLIWTAGCVIFAFIIGIVLACYVDERKKMEGVYRGFLLLPWIIPSIIVVFIWRWMLQSDLGILNYFIMALGISDQPVMWLSDERVVMMTVIMVNTWKAYTTWFIMLLAGLKSLPLEQVESARIDGASSFDIFMKIKIPHLKPVIMTTGVLCIIWAINYVELIYSMTGGGPDNATMTMPVMSYILGFETYDFGRSSAMATLTLVLVFLLIIPYIRIMFKQLKEGANT